MSITFSRLNIHVEFAVKGRQKLIHPIWEVNLHKYICQIVQRKGQKLLAINGMPNHIHLLIGRRPEMRLSDLIREIKKSSNNFIRESEYCSNLSWQEGYGAFTYNHLDLLRVIQYIMNQKEHQRGIDLKGEFKNLLKEFQIDLDEKYVI